VKNVALDQIVVICGPTAVGKTALAVDLARQFNGEIVGADSMQIYRRLDIGTAKPSSAERAAVPHHMVDILEPHEDFDAAAYGRRAGACVVEVIRRGKLPFVVGGTGLYIKALIYGLTEAAPSDETVRSELKSQLEQAGPQAMHARLAQIDPQSARRIHPNDAFRILRALEVFQITGRPMAAHHDEHGFAQARFDALKIGLSLPRDRLYARIDRRVDAMLSEGLAGEVRGLLDQGCRPWFKSMQALGYRHMTDYLQGRLELAEAVRTLKRDHRRYAKRQLTWFGADPRVQWLQPDQSARAAALIRGFLSASGSPQDHRSG
jgi:tRNA dimethylallyltransferase